VNPAHLFLGTPQDNMIDKVRKGRARGALLKGEAHQFALLTDEVVRSIRRRQELGEPRKAIAASLNIHISTVRSVLVGRTWSHVQ